MSRRAVVVLCAPPYEICRENWQAGRERDEEMFTSEIKHFAEWAKFKALQSTFQTPASALMVDAPRTELPVVTYDYTKDSVYDVMDRICDYRPGYNQGPGIGCFEHGTFLLVGDESNKRSNPLALPFVADEGCSPWLAACLDAWGVAEGDLYWINATRADGLETDGRFTHVLWPSRVIALGDEAQRWVKRRDFAGGTQLIHVPHPQYWKRFNHHAEYTPLKEALS